MNWRTSCGLLLWIALPAQSAAADGQTADSWAGMPASGPDMLGTVAKPIRAERFGESLQRARQDASRSPMLQRLIAAARPLPPIQQLAFVQQAVSSSIRWVSDTTEWGQHDYWASASQTLERGAGDME